MQQDKGGGDWLTWYTNNTHYVINIYDVESLEFSDSKVSFIKNNKTHNIPYDYNPRIVSRENINFNLQKKAEGYRKEMEAMKDG